MVRPVSSLEGSRFIDASKVLSDSQGTLSRCFASGSPRVTTNCPSAEGDARASRMSFILGLCVPKAVCCEMFEETKSLGATSPQDGQA